MDIRQHEGKLQLLIRWKGLDDEVPQSEAYQEMTEGVPGIVHDFVKDILSDKKQAAENYCDESRFINRMTKIQCCSIAKCRRRGVFLALIDLLFCT